jgi:alpha-aminoadipic semialdehyde synthase
MTVMKVEVDVKWPDQQRERQGLGQVVYGQPNGHSAMARTVGYTLAIVIQMILKGTQNTHTHTPD